MSSVLVSGGAGAAAVKSRRPRELPWMTIVSRRSSRQRSLSAGAFARARWCCHQTSPTPKPVEPYAKRRCAPLLENTFIPMASDFVAPEWKAVPDIWKSSAEKFGNQVALVDLYHDPPSKITYKELEQEILNFSEGLRRIGVLPEEKLAILADNSCRWLIADQGIMATGAINVVRGTRSSNEELFQIYSNSESVALVVDSPQFLDRLAQFLIPRVSVRFIILLWGDKTSFDQKSLNGLPLYDYRDIIELGKEGRSTLLQSYGGNNDACEAITPKDIATLMYTSGTGGSPKGVMLTHQNLLHQINSLWDIVPVKPGDRFLSMLPSWHAYERACEYFILAHGAEQVYTNIKRLKEDLPRYRPQYLISVPLVYETLCSSIQRQITASTAARRFIAQFFINVSLIYMETKRIYEGKAISRTVAQQSLAFCIIEWLWSRTVAALLWPLHYMANRLVFPKIRSAVGISKAGISGGGSLPLYVDKFFETIGIKVQNGYGLTETSPVVAARAPTCNVLGTAGHPIKHTKIQIVDIETGELLPDGSKGIVRVRGPQVMKGYYKNLLATGQALDDEGWFNTGDIGWIVPKHAIGRSRECGGMLVLEGRAKDTIVLSTGENVDPTELEEAASRSSLIEQILVVGQDKRRIGAIIYPREDEVRAMPMEIRKDKLTNLLREELRKWTASCTFQIGPILIAEEPFTVENGLMTPTMKIRRDKVVAKYREQIDGMYK